VLDVSVIGTASPSTALTSNVELPPAMYANSTMSKTKLPAVVEGENGGVVGSVGVTPLPLKLSDPGVVDAGTANTISFAEYEAMFASNVICGTP
jgi:hypothetical protein